MDHGSVRPARGLDHLHNGRQRGRRVMLAPWGKPVTVLCLHEQFHEQWIHFDEASKKDVPHFEPVDCCPFCFQTGGREPRCYLHIGVMLVGHNREQFLLKVPDTALLHARDVLDFHEKKGLLGHALEVSRLTPFRCGPVKLSLTDRPVSRFSIENRWQLALAVEHLYRIEHWQKVANEIAAGEFATVKGGEACRS
jgi:hypothetical protein